MASGAERGMLNRATGLGPLVCSALAFVIVMANVIAGVPPQPDENASAHLWQLLMVVQLPLIGLFIATSDWRRRSTMLLFGLQVIGIALACLPVWLAGY